MTKKTFSKVIAVVLVAAVCFAAIFTGTVSATADHSAACTVTGSSYNPGAKDSYVTAEVTFTSDDAFTAGTFFVSADSGLKFLDASAATSVGGAVPNVYMNINNNKVLFAGFEEDAVSAIRSYTSLTLVLKFVVTTGALSSVSAGTGWAVNVTDVDLTNSDEETYETSGATGYIHVHSFVASGDPVDGVQTYACDYEHGCSVTKKEIAVDNTLTVDAKIPTNLVNVTFTTDGDTVLNALLPASYESVISNTYFTYTYKDDDGEHTATSTCAGTCTQSETTYYVFPCGRNGGIGRINQNVTGTFIIVSGSTKISNTWSHSIKEYAEGLVSTGTAAQQNYAKALWNYAKRTTIAVGTAEAQATYGDYYTGITDWSSSETSSWATAVSTGTDDDWKLSKAKVTTGFKPKMTLTFTGDFLATSTNSITIKVKDGSSNLVYSKEVAVSNLDGGVYVLSDIPTKYLIYDIEISAKIDGSESAKTTVYSYGRYTRARQLRTNPTDPNADVFVKMLTYATYLAAAF